MYVEMLDELISLLEKAEVRHWANWFRNAKELFVQGNAEKSYKKVLGAYGGMGSFNDVYWRLPEEDERRHDFLKDEIRMYAESKLHSR
ncbi:DUF6966 domain-containing protein [Hahella ganghwensis]|uniref:DUF6966 domain-containing protein n=1 Tax=Hahella ganghwensis TaxID=286420 RepID=UPI00035E42F2|nr:hypothetical protein [Hahella ganghwensis]